MRRKYIAIQISPFALLNIFIHYDGGFRIQIKNKFTYTILQKLELKITTKYNRN